MGTWSGDNEYDEVNDCGTVNFNGCKPIGECGIEITVAEGWDDSNRRRHILLTCEGGAHGTEYSMDVDKAEALGLLLVSAARGMRSMGETLDRHQEIAERQTEGFVPDVVGEAARHPEDEED